jgi:hypothetical protein
MTDLSPEGSALLKGVRDDFDASPEDCDRVGRALASRLGLGAGTLVGSAGGSSASVAAAGVGAKWTGVVLLLVAMGVGGFLYYRAASDAHAGPGGSVVTVPLPQPRAPDVRRAPTEAPSAELDVRQDQPSAPPSRPTPELTVRTQTPESPSRVTDREHAGIPTAPARGVDGTLGAETRLLRQADSELRNRNASRALELLDEHARTFPHGVLSEERSAERITTLCALGRVDEARDEARRFLAAAADSPLAKVVRSSCGVGDDGEKDVRAR